MSEAKAILLLGVGGMGMAPLALLLAGSGVRVVGHDAMLSPVVRELLVNNGVEIEDFLLAEHIGNFAEVVHSSALSPQHPLLVAARECGLPLHRRGERLAQLLSAKKLLAIAGSHGKTTTTALLVHAMQAAGLEPTYAIGGLPADGSSPARWTDSEWALVEVDESDGTMEAFSPHATLLLNADWDHSDQYADEAALAAAFARLIVRTEGAVVLGPGLRKHFAEVVAGHRFYSLDDFDWSALTELPQEAFNCDNALHAAALLQAVGVRVPADAFAGFAGVARRQGVLYADDRSLVIEDYAHHPCEISVLLDALAVRYPQHAIRLVFQPHRFSRTACLAQGFAKVLRQVAAVWLLPVYAAHESYRENGSSQNIARLLGDSAQLLEPRLDALAELTQFDTTAQKCVYAFVGAGDIAELATWFACYLAAAEDKEQAYLEWCQRHVTSTTYLSSNQALAANTTLRVGGAARWYAEPAGPADLRFILRAARLAGLPVFFLGRGSNLIVSDDGFPGWVIRLKKPCWRKLETLPGERIYAGAGVRLKDLCGFAAKSGLSGFEFMEGIPGEVGGSLRMNAGAMGAWLFDRVESVLLMSAEGVLRRIPAAQFHVHYRRVDELVDAIALGAVFHSAEVAVPLEDVRRKMGDYANARKESQPREASAGCIFKNPPENSAGKLIDSCGLKGLRIGDAEVSSVHANFIINRGQARAADIIALVKAVRQKVFAQTGVWLEPEALLVGMDWPTVLSESSVANPSASVVNPSYKK